jgi:hypothetical protein
LGQKNLPSFQKKKKAEAKNRHTVRRSFPRATERVHRSAHIVSVIYSDLPLLNLNRYLPVPKRSDREKKKEMALFDDSDVLVGRAWRCWMISMCCDVA